MNSRCWSCGGSSLTPIFSIDGIALSSLILMDSAEQAHSFPRGDLELVVCRSCGFIYNRLFRPEAVDYTMPYEESQAYSPRFREFEEELVDHLVTDYKLAGKDIFEIGCGKASFLETLCRRPEPRVSESTRASSRVACRRMSKCPVCGNSSTPTIPI